MAATAEMRRSLGLQTQSLVLSCLCFQVKQIMEEAVTKKFVHEDSSHIIALCSK